MDLAALCDIYSYVCGAENGTNVCRLAVISVNIVFAHHLVAPHHIHHFRSVCDTAGPAETVRMLQFWRTSLLKVKMKFDF